LPELQVSFLRTHFIHICFLTALVLSSMVLSLVAQAQAPEDGASYARKNTFGIFGAYSGDSSHILLGQAQNRMLLDVGVSYSRRLILNHKVNWQYNGELLPVALESDPMSLVVVTDTRPAPMTFSYNGGPVISCAPITTSLNYTDPTTGITYSSTSTTTCQGRRWVAGEGMSPVGFQWNFVPQRKMQPFLIAHGGFMYSTQAIPIYYAGSFNFTFDIGAGVEIYRTRTKSIRAEYRYHHISNNNTANMNPGIDNGLLQFTYCFGR
jgi:opacity protein-like surface antigen